MSDEPAPGLEADLLRKIVQGRSPGYMSSVLDEFMDDHGMSIGVEWPRGEPMPEQPVIVLAKNLARKGLITYEEGRMWPQVEATVVGRRWVRDHPA